MLNLQFKMSLAFHFRLLAFVFTLITCFTLSGQDIPLPEHPRPDFERKDWVNLNGIWSFRFDQENQGLDNQWTTGSVVFDREILVPFPWGSASSGVNDEADIAWYQREITIDENWKGKRTFLTIGASDWETTVWLDGHLLGSHQGGYVPFSFELTEHVDYGNPQKLVIRVDDVRRDFTLYGKQGYGNARGIWQTIFLEARGQEYIEAVHFTPDIDQEKVTATIYLAESPGDIGVITVEISDGTQTFSSTVEDSGQIVKAVIEIPDPHLWSLDDPHLYDARISLGGDVVHSYFGMRKISVVDLPGTNYPYVAINDKPIYLQLALDQSYHPEGFYTFPSDDFMKEEIAMTKRIGLNGIRPHIKVEIPRKLYWADKLGVLVMADLPNSWGEPGPRARAASEYTMREMIKRDYNHPSIFSWVLFNETWGLRTKVEKHGKTENIYLPETQNWVASMYYLAKSLDQTRLVEDNSICCGAGHTETDLNSFHDYLPGWKWTEHLADITERSHPGSPFQFEDGFTQGNQPKINSECGNVWGYEGSTGDVDWSWDYHRMMNSFRLFPEIAGWLYTEHHDVINEWNGYWRFDRSEKYTGLEDVVEGMSLEDLHAPVYLSPGNDLCHTVKGGEKVMVPLYISSMTDQYDQQKMTIRYELVHTDLAGRDHKTLSGEVAIKYKPYIQEDLTPLDIKMPSQRGLAILKLYLANQDGEVIHRNFVFYEVSEGESLTDAIIWSKKPTDLKSSEWSKKQWEVLDGLKVNGAGSGYFEYAFAVPKDFNINSVEEATFLVEVSAKELFVKDTDQKNEGDIDFMLGGKDAPSRNPNSYPMTDETLFPSSVQFFVNGHVVKTLELPDDPADHRGVLSWHHQLKDNKLREAGSYGYLVSVPITSEHLNSAIDKGQLIIKIASSNEGGLAIYGENFGRYPINPSVVLIKK